MTGTFIYDCYLLTVNTVGTMHKYLKKYSKNTCLRINTVKFNHLQQYIIIFEVRKSVHHHTIQIIQPTRCNIFTSLLLDVYVWLNMFRTSPRPSSGAYNCSRSLWFYRWREAVGALERGNLPDHDQQRSNRFSPTVKPEVLVQLYAPDDGRGDARNMLSHT